MTLSNRVFSRFSHLLLGAVAVALVLATPAVGQAGEPWPSLFDSRALPAGSLSRFTKWVSTLKRYAAERKTAERSACRTSADAACGYRRWQTFLDGLRDAGKWQQLVAVNRYMNARRYVNDDRNWGVRDYWETPGEFLTRSGDCEDFAIAKFLSLKRLGWSDDELRIVAVKDLRAGTGHAVLVVRFVGKTWLLDNQLKEVTATDGVRRYRAVFSINEKAWWVHRPAARA